jgi:hypothetical protein
MELTGSLKTVVQTFAHSIPEKLSKKCFFILFSVLGHWLPLGLSVKSSLTSHAESTKNFSTPKILANSGTLFLTMSLTLSGEYQQKLLLTPILTALKPVFLSQLKVVNKTVTK